MQLLITDIHPLPSSQMRPIRPLIDAYLIYTSQPGDTMKTVSKHRTPNSPSFEHVILHKVPTSAQACLGDRSMPRCSLKGQSSKGDLYPETQVGPCDATSLSLERNVLQGRWESLQQIPFQIHESWGNRAISILQPHRKHSGGTEMGWLASPSHSRHLEAWLMTGLLIPTTILSHPPGLKKISLPNRNPLAKTATGRTEFFGFSQLVF